MFLGKQCLVVNFVDVRLGEACRSVLGTPNIDDSFKVEKPRFSR